MNHASRLFINILCLLGLVFVTQQVVALSDDNKQPINVSADSAQKNDKKGLATYEGDVIITQGSIRITGDKITIHDSNGRVNKITAIGTPATFKQRPDNSDQDIAGQANSLVYDIKTELLTLTGNALLEQEGNTTESNKIVYDMQQSIIKAGDAGGRVNNIILPAQ